MAHANQPRPGCATGTGSSGMNATRWRDAGRRVLPQNERGNPAARLDGEFRPDADH
jgi:hypothetical protein